MSIELLLRVGEYTEDDELVLGRQVLGDHVVVAPEHDRAHQPAQLEVGRLAALLLLVGRVEVTRLEDRVGVPGLGFGYG